MEVAWMVLWLLVVSLVVSGARYKQFLSELMEEMTDQTFLGKKESLAIPFTFKL